MNMTFGPEEATYSTLEYAYMIKALNDGTIDELKSEPADHIMSIRNGKIPDSVIHTCPYETISLATTAAVYSIGDIIKAYSPLISPSAESYNHYETVKMLKTYGNVSVICENLDKIVNKISDIASERKDEELMVLAYAGSAQISRCYQTLLIAHRLLTIFQVVNHMIDDDMGVQKGEELNSKDTL